MPSAVQWPSQVITYTNLWPTNAEEIVIASLQGSGPIDAASNVNFSVYFQNNPAAAGFNPNDEHGETTTLTEDEIKALIAYLKAL